MARFFVAASNILGGAAYIDGEDLKHIKVLRIRQGETFTLCDGEGTDYTCVLGESDLKGAMCAEILSKAPSAGEPTVKCSVFAAYSKGERMDVTVQKCVELGASEIIVFPSERCVSKPDGAGVIKKLERWRRIAEEAAKQSGRGRIPPVTAAHSFAAAVELAARADVPLFLYEEERATSIRTAIEAKPDAKSFAVMTGPEGGFEPAEAAYAAKNGMLSVTLGARILRCETAPMTALTAVMLLTDNMQ